MGAGGFGGGTPRGCPAATRGAVGEGVTVPRGSPAQASGVVVGCGVCGVLWFLMRLVSVGWVWGCVLLGKASWVCVCPPPTMALCPRRVTPCTPTPSPGWVGGWWWWHPQQDEGLAPKLPSGPGGAVPGLGGIGVTRAGGGVRAPQPHIGVRARRLRAHTLELFLLENLQARIGVPAPQKLAPVVGFSGKRG